MPSGSKGLPGPLTQEVAAILRANAARQRMNQSALSAASGISASQVNRMLAGVKHIDIEQLEALANALDLDARIVMNAGQRHCQRRARQTPHCRTLSDSDLRDEIPTLSADEVARDDLDLASEHGHDEGVEQPDDDSEDTAR